jgi:lipopolysaccharide transport system ATP-binding protein
MGDVILKIENLSKQYQLGQFGTGTIGRDVDRWWRTKILKQEDPYLMIGAINDRTSKEKTNFVWALKDINFEVKRGEVVGIIGKNGAGKSTLLKLLSRITSPTRGTIKSAGRMASLLEVGTGFHPELTGRENIYLNGAILGMTKKEIQSKFDEIVDFSGCELYIDTPTKRYSSGMTVRLGFAVAAFLDPEILIVDEVLAVGDAEFQKKAIGKMKDVSLGEGKTVLVVSHNMASIAEMCNRCVLFDRGQLIYDGGTQDVIQRYLSVSKSKFEFIKDIQCSQEVVINLLTIENVGNNIFLNSEDVIINLQIIINKDIEKLLIAFNIFSASDSPIVRIGYNDYNDIETLGKGTHTLVFRIPKFHLAVGKYRLELDLAIPNVEKLINDISIDFEVYSMNSMGDKYKTRNSIVHNSIIRPDWLVKIEKN